MVVPNQSSCTGPAGYQQNPLGIDIFWPYSFDPDTALTDFHAGPVKREKPHSGTISVDENLKGAKNIQGFKPVEYDNIDIQAHLNDPLIKSQALTPSPPEPPPPVEGDGTIC